VGRMESGKGRGIQNFL